jgi:SAM-dependent methyltransferase
MGAEWFFADHDDWARIERNTFELVHGRVLDIGAGAGRHSLVVQRRQLESVAIDISPGAVEVCRRRGVRDARVLPLDEIDESLGVFDTVLLLCGNFGLAGGWEETIALLEKLHSLTGPGARIVLDTVDPYVDNDDADLAYLERNRKRGRMPGQMTIRIRYDGLTTPWYDLLCVDVLELQALIEGTGWDPIFLGEDGSDVYAVLEKTSSRRPAASGGAEGARLRLPAASRRRGP